MADVQPGGDRLQVERAMDEEMAGFLRDGPTAAELEEANIRIRADYVRGIERIGGFGGRSDILAQGQVYAGDPDLIPKRVNAAQIAQGLATIAAELRAFSELDASHVTLNVLKDKLDAALEIYSDVILNPSFPQSELDRLKKETIAEIQQEKAQPISMALRVLPLLLYGKVHTHAMPLTGIGTEESVGAVTRDGLQKFHSTWFKPANSTLPVVGDIGMAELRRRLERVFAAWKVGEVPRKEIPEVAPRQAGRVYILDRPGAEQTLVMTAQLIPPKPYTRDIAFQLFNDAFGGAFGSRINLNIREDKHWSYGAGSAPVEARGQRVWFAYAPVQTHKTKETLQEILKELRDVKAARPISAKELQEAKDRQTRTLAGRWETGGAVIGALREIATFGLPEHYHTTFAARIHAVTRNEVAAAISETVQPERAVYVLVGDRSKIEAGIRELNLGAVEFLDADGNPKPQ